MFLYQQFFGALRMSGGYFQFQAPQLRVIPLRNATPRTKRQISRLMDRTKSDAATQELRDEVTREIDEIFCRIYELDDNDAAVVLKG